GQALPMVDVVSGGERPSAQLTSWSEGLTDSTGISVAALNAYGYAEAVMAYQYPECHLRWNTIAGIGYVETRHGTYGGSSIDENGIANPPIIGVALDGSPGFASIPDTDGGELDGDPDHDRAVGPMQFIPETWKRYGEQATGNPAANPNSIDDAALAAAEKFCSSEHDMQSEQGWTDAILSYNQSEKYVRDVRDAAAAYSVPTRAR
ncbi:lytic transglycosylase domain-containing protein, partial [Dietzia sp.]|uniref:lytic transglycosylase domain-containing protein n=1 Tax=Dietzia sp. TaxID=1871616 RepID=UPI002FD91EE0